MYLLKLLSFFLLSVSYVVGELKSQTPQEDSKWTPVLEQKGIHLDSKRLLESHKMKAKLNTVKKGAEFLDVHSKELIENLKLKRRVYTAKNVPKNIHRMGTSEIADLDSNITYFLHKDQNYFVLDEEETRNLFIEVEDSSVVFCGQLKPNDLIFGTNNNNWLESKSGNLWKSFVLPKSNILISRKVLKNSDSKNPDKRCTRFETEEIHPMKLFEGYKTSALARPNHDVFYKPSFRNRKYSLESFPGDTFDSPVTPCDQYLPSDEKMYDHHTDNDDYSAFTDYSFSEGCYSINNKLSDIPSFNFNYDPSTNKASSNLYLGYGITCVNCYAYLGVFYLVNFEYQSYGDVMNFEVKVDGSTGFNSELSVDNPTISSSQYIVLLNPSSQIYSIPLGCGILLETNFGGLSSTLSGSGSASGSISTGTGASADAYYGYLYYYESASDTGSEFPSTLNFQYTPPYLTSSGFQADQITIQAELIAVQYFALSYTYVDIEYISANFSVTVTSMLTYQYTSSVGSSVVSSEANSPATIRSPNISKILVYESKDPSNNRRFSPGDRITIELHFQDFLPNETNEMFYSMFDKNKKSSYGVPLFHTQFIVPESGNGILYANWTIPFDTHFIDHKNLISTHSSNDVMTNYFSDVFEVKTGKPLVSQPMSDQYIAINSTINVEWQANLLFFFRAAPGIVGHGSIESVETVGIDFIAEKIAANGSVLNSNKFRLNYSIPNDYKTQITFDASQFAAFTNENGYRCHLILRSKKYYNLQGASDYFYLTSYQSLARKANRKLRGLITHDHNRGTQRVSSLVKKILHSSTPLESKSSSYTSKKEMDSKVATKSRSETMHPNLMSSCGGCTNEISFALNFKAEINFVDFFDCTDCSISIDSSTPYYQISNTCECPTMTMAAIEHDSNKDKRILLHPSLKSNENLMSSQYAYGPITDDIYPSIVIETQPNSPSTSSTDSSSSKSLSDSTISLISVFGFIGLVILVFLSYFIYSRYIQNPKVPASDLRKYPSDEKREDSVDQIATALETDEAGATKDLELSAQKNPLN